MIKKCSNCKTDYSARRRLQRFCTNTCYLIFRTKYKTQADLKDGFILRTMWKQYHAHRNNFDEIITLMYREKFTINKDFIKHE